MHLKWSTSVEWEILVDIYWHFYQSVKLVYPLFGMMKGQDEIVISGKGHKARLIKKCTSLTKVAELFTISHPLGKAIKIFLESSRAAFFAKKESLSLQKFN